MDVKMNHKNVIKYLNEALPLDTEYDVWYDDMNGRWIIEVEDRK